MKKKGGGGVGGGELYPLLVLKLSNREKSIGSFSKVHLLTGYLMSRHCCNLQQNTGEE